MGKFNGIILLFGLLLTMMVGLTQGLRCHKCNIENGVNCTNVEEGKESSFSVDCPATENTNMACKTFGSETSGFVRGCYNLVVEKEEKVGCENVKGGGKLCYCQADNCNGKEPPKKNGSKNSSSAAGKYYYLFTFGLLYTTFSHHFY